MSQLHLKSTSSNFDFKGQKVKRYSFPYLVISELYWAQLPQYSVTCHPIESEQDPALTPARQAGTQFAYPVGMARLS